ncbi:flagellar biosynthesis anti-sigma factor FlgM [Azoarcus olearius]|uniref:Negative regulator of flagellin synthesis n=1 Tax=Azoarcus sp. (strain BH72) TaxID=418699 RepID=A1K953_AZOSB|nr:flagellar biosynthesis anti-sigma factor FlgM [Azoarcus olearius]ANQ85905.1 putative negative regulator of flagellin synthesis FlgM [Azoarcus olearius]CAL95358.1 putative negative regulator of flagellin synthesis FlgM [Azoarcus olearius]
MKIESSGKPVAGVSVAENRGRVNTPKTETPASSDKVQLSSLSSTLQKAEAAMENTPAVDSSRVAEIRQAIAEGRFKIDSSKIADGLINSVRDLLGDKS